MLFLFETIVNTNDIFIGLTLRHSGNSTPPFDSNNMAFYVGDEKKHVLDNRITLAKAIGIDLTHWVFLNVSHGTNIHKVTLADKAKGAYHDENAIKQTDAIYTREKNLVLTVFHADCIPLVFYDQKQKLLGVVHAGWKGTLANITGKFIDHWIQHEQSDPNDIHVYIGPSLSQKYFSIKEDVIHIIQTHHPKYNKYLHYIDEHHALFDAITINASQIKACHIPPQNITIDHRCTFSDRKNFFSYRRDHTTGRHITFCFLR